MARREIITFYTVSDIAGALDVHEKTVRRAIKAGDLVAHLFGSQYRIAAEDYRTYVASRRGRRWPPLSI